MAETILFGIAAEVLNKLGSGALNDIASAWRFKTQLKKLKNTINSLKDVLLDAEDRQADDRAVRGWLERLSTVVYAADDLFDEFNVVAARKQLMGERKLAEEVRTFFSNSNQVAFACKISQKIKKIRKELDDIEKDGKKFEFVCGSPERGIARRMRDQSMSYVDQHEVVGRDDDKNKLLDMLLASSSTKHELGHEELPVIPIVGMGGMGKTSLAQFIYNNPQVKDCFDLRLWVCVSDVFDIKVIVEKLLKSATNEGTLNLEMDQLQGLMRKEVADKRYLLVLDDVWNEQRKEWLILRDLLKIGRKGSKILVTTRSREVAKIMGTSPPHDLQGLSEEKSWKLFEKMAFSNPEEAQQKSYLVKIGKEIVKKCGHVPLAIRTLGTLLYGQEERKWLLLKDTSLATIRDNQSDIMNILRLSYHHLWSPLKNCFAYCALFPKDYRYRKEMLIDHWIAQGFIVPPSNNGQSLDEAAEEYFHTLLQRGFFQDIERHDLGDIESCKMHDFMHDLAEEVAGVKCKVAKFDEIVFDDKILHLSLAYQLTSRREIPKSALNVKLLHTFLLLEQIVNGSTFGKSISQELLTRFKSLRVLDLNKLGLKSLPSSICKLIHLRYLNLSETYIENLTDSITELWNLQTLRLFSCSKLKTLPANMRKLTNLRSLDVSGCANLSHMPSGLGGLTSLNSLPLFIVERERNDAANSRYKPTPTAKLSDLKNLNKLRGTLHIDIKDNMGNTMVEARKAELRNKHQLTVLCISYPHISFVGCVTCVSVADFKHYEDVLQGLQPPSNIKSLSIYHYIAENAPSWARMDNLCTTLPYLVEITLWGWNRCQQLPDFSQLPFLKRLKLGYMGRVEYIESDNVSGVPSSIFFPSLEQLELDSMENVKGWWKEEVEASVNENDTSERERERASNDLAGQRLPTRFMKFSKLPKLCIINCPNLRLLPVCPNVEDLSLLNTNETLSVLKMATTSTSSSSTGSGLKLRKLEIDNAEDLLSLPNHCLLQLSFLRIIGDNKLESTD